VEVSAYRIAQEALTNVVRHAGPVRAHVWLRYQPSDIEIEVTDEGGASPAGPQTPDGPQHGLIGMRERVALYGGELIAGPSGAGFRVLARLPVDDDRR
jgi:signal transduction histidine kinase